MTLREIYKQIPGDLKVSRFSLAKAVSYIYNEDPSRYIFNDSIDIPLAIAQKIVKHFVSGYPLAYIANRVSFCSSEFYVDERVLIPRQETQDLAEYAMKMINSCKIKSVADIGTGSGVIAVILKKFHPDLHVFASDISSQALEVAKYNACKNMVKIDFREGMFMEPFVGEEVDMIVSNPPYVHSSYNNPDLQYEPANALYAGEKGQDFFIGLSKYEEVKKVKYMLFETTEFFIEETCKILSQFGDIEKLTDRFGIYRFIKVLRD